MTSKVVLFRAGERDFAIRIFSTLDGYSSRLMERLSDELVVPAALHTPFRQEIPPSTFYQFRSHYRNELIEQVKCELLNGRVKRLTEEEAKRDLDSYIRANLKGWPDGYRGAVNDDLSDWNPALD